jgi:putative NADH-flavin reductase
VARRRLDQEVVMKVVIFGASGRTGRALVQQALERGHEVRAFARTPAKIEVEHERLEIVQGDVQDVGAVERAVAGVDAVLSVLGPTSNRPGRPVTQGTRNVLDAMKRHGVRRIVMTGGAGVRDRHDRPGLVDRLVKGLLLLAARNVYEDMRGAVEAVRSSDLDWTVVRLPRLTDAPATGHVRADHLGGDVGIQIGRADVATFLLDELESGRWVGRAPVVSN